MCVPEVRAGSDSDQDRLDYVKSFLFVICQLSL